MLSYGMSLIFYDLETSGTSQHFDQILQFAAIEVDDDLTEMSRIEMRSRLQPHIIPAPAALHVTGMTIERITDPSLPSNFATMTAIRDWLGGRCPSTFLGWNSLRFDEEFLRHAFYQCLHPAYLTNTGGSGRADMLHIARAATLIDPNVLEVPTTDAGKPTYKLDRLAPANGFEDMQAHDALGDVEATIHICRLVQTRLPDFWRQALRLSRKGIATDFVEGERAFVLFEASGAHPVANVVAPLGKLPGQSNVMLCLDLRCDLDELEGLNTDDLGKRLKRSPQPIRRVKVNAAPVMLRLNEAPRHLLSDLDEETIRLRADLLRSSPGLVERLMSASQSEATEWDVSPHVEQQLYQGFWSGADGALLDRFHKVPWEERVAIAAQLEDQRLRRLARRIIHAERPDLLSAEVRVMMASDIVKRRQGSEEGGEPWLTVPKAMDELEKLLSRLPPEMHAEFAGFRRALRTGFASDSA